MLSLLLLLVNNLVFFVNYKVIAYIDCELPLAPESPGNPETPGSPESPLSPFGPGSPSKPEKILLFYHRNI